MSLGTNNLGPLPNTIFNIFGEEIDLTGEKWSFQANNERGDVLTINWKRLNSSDGNIYSDTALQLNKLFIISRLQVRKPYTVIGDFGMLQRLAKYIHQDCHLDSMFGWDLLSEDIVRGFYESEMTTANKGNYFSKLKELYIWGILRQHSDFNFELWRVLEGFKIVGNTKGERVRSHDPEEGPFHKDELVLIGSGLPPDSVPESMRDSWESPMDEMPV